VVDAAARESPPSGNAAAPGTRCGGRGGGRTRGRDLAGVGDAELGESISVGLSVDGADELRGGIVPQSRVLIAVEAK
jgi:hypothetical protein